jgi:NADH dehydrogenase/putative oxidoreductase
MLNAVVWPPFELLMRLWLARLFFVSGLFNLMHSQGLMMISGHELPMPLPVPAAIAHVGGAIQFAASILLACGAMTRYACALLLGLVVISQAAHQPMDTQLFWIALLGYCSIAGAGSWSIDGLLRHGLAHSAVPGVSRLLVLTEWIRCRLGPVYVSMLRVWLAVTLIAIAKNFTGSFIGPGHTVLQWLPLEGMARVPRDLVWIAGTSLFFGAGTRYAALTLILVVSAGAMMHPHMMDVMTLCALLTLFVVRGGGIVSLDRVIDKLLHGLLANHTRFPMRREEWPHVVIVGAGFGGLSCATGLRRATVRTTLIDRNNYHLFQPLLYQVATAGLSPGDIAAPVRPLFRDDSGIRVLWGTVSAVDTDKQVVMLDAQPISYDYLVLATGATHGYFGNDRWAIHAPGLKGVADAIDIRRRILTAFERAEAASEPAQRTSLLTFLIVGGGPTGVELAGAIAELARFGMNKEFRTFDPAESRILLVQSAPRLLPTFPESLSAIAQRSLEKLGVEVLLGSRVEDIDADGVVVNGVRILANTVLWAAGVAASPAAAWLKVAPDPVGRIRVNPDLSVPGVGNVFAIGDTAASRGWNGNPVPGLAPAARQGGAYVARQIRARADGKLSQPEFRYRHLGSLATIGRKAAVADFGFIKMSGEPAWWLWGLVHVGFLVGTRNRVSTLLNWFWAYLTLGVGIRLITGTDSRKLGGGL